MAKETTKATREGISPAIVIIPLGLGLGFVAVLALAGIAGVAAPPTPSPGKATLYGKVADSETGDAVAGATLTIDGIQTYTDTGGNYTFSDVEPGNYTLTVAKSGWATISESITLPEGLTQANISMVATGALDQFYMPPTLQVSAAGPVNGEYTVTFSTKITNKGKAAGRHQMFWGTNETQDEYREEGSQYIPLEPGQTFNWSQTWYGIPDYYLGYFTCWCYGDWETDNAAMGVWQ